MEKPSYVIGLDLGQCADPTALAIVERPPPPPPPPQVAKIQPAAQELPVYSLRHLQRFPLGTSYVEIVKEVAALTKKPPLAGACKLVVDQTGVGRPVVDLLRQARLDCPPVPVTITTGHAVTLTADGWHVAKVELVSALKVLFQARRLKTAKGPNSKGRRLSVGRPALVVSGVL